MGLIGMIISMVEALSSPPHYVSALDSSERLKREIARFVKKKGKAGILDIGMGEGELAEAVLSACPEVSYFGVDRERSVLKTASNRLERFGPRVSLATGEIECMSEVPALTGRKFDFIFLFEVLCFIEPGRPRRQAVLERVFTSLSGMLEAGGRIMIIENDASHVLIPTGDFDAVDRNCVERILSGLKLKIETSGPLEGWAGETNDQIQYRFILIARKKD